MEVLILGKGRVGLSIQHYLKKIKAKRVAFFSGREEIKKFQLLIGALPGKIGEKSWQLALRYKKDLIDVSDLDPKDYLKFSERAKEKEIRIIPECGFSPGFTNLVCGYEESFQKIEKIEILAGTISKIKFFFPFTWCFEDLIEGYQEKALLIKKGKKIFLPPFSGYRKERIKGILAESYFASGLSSLPLNLSVKNLSYRVLRPFGFFYFFQFLKNQGFLKKENLKLTKKILESKKGDNLTIGQIKIFRKKQKTIWQIESFSKKKEKLNSMQKITGLIPALIAKALFENKIKGKGILSMEKIGQDKKLFKEILSQLRKEGILIKKL